MSTTDRQAGATAQESASAATTPLVAALQSLSRAYQKTTIYPPGHPAVSKALKQAVSGFAEAYCGDGSIVVAAARDHFRVDDEPLAEENDALQSLASMLFDLDIAALEFHDGLAVEELESFIRLIGSAKQEGRKGAALVDDLAESGARRVLARAINYDALRFTEGSRDPGSQVPDQDVWENVSRILADPESTGGELSPAELAAEVSHEISAQEGTGIGLLRQRIAGLNRQSGSLDSDQRQRLQQRLSTFVSSLSPKLRQDLLHVDPDMPEASVDLMAKVAEELPESDLLRALRQLDNIGARMPDQMLTLLNKLVRISRRRPSLAAGLNDRLSRWGISSEVLAGSPDNLQSALEEVFQRRARSDFIPQTHRTLLDNLSRQTVDAGEFDFDARYRDPRDPDAVRLQGAQIAARLLGGKDGERHRAGIFAFLASAADSLIEMGEFEVVRDAAISARGYSLSKREPEQNRRAADGYLQEFRSSRRVSLILTHGSKSDGFDEAALALLVLGGQPALDGVLGLLNSAPHSSAAPALRGFARARGAEALAEALEARNHKGWPALRLIMTLLREMDTSEVVPLLEKLSRHDELRVRREALRTLCEKDERPGSKIRHLFRGLRDPSPRVVSYALLQLTEMDQPDAIDLMGEYIEADFSEVIPPPDFARRAARSLLDKGEPGIDRLCTSLERLSKNLHPRRVRLAAVVAETMKKRMDDSKVRNSVKRWRISPAGVAALVVPSSGNGSKRPQ
jgi:hypothetical protein